MADVAEFSFLVPDCQPGAVVKVPAPDGVTLQMPLPKNVSYGDELFFGKGEDGQWKITKALRGSAEENETAGASSSSAGRSAQQPASQWRPPELIAADLAGAGVITAKLETTKGPILMRIVRRWSPHGVRRFLQLIDEDYYHNICIYRAIRGGLLQFGIVQNGDPRSGRYPAIPDDPLVGVPFEEGTVAFASAGPGTRKATLCLFLGDFRDQLGYSSQETPIGKVCPESMETLHSIFTGYGDIPQCNGKGPDPDKLEAWGNDYIAQEFPECDYITGADHWYDPRFVN
mmetsp:Transcript_73498/g.137332  ORF Transcript_73498/g.137332 Transcript_73498/m.137332 type:complete len:287 (+) Transcript_73498:80-940(+)